MPNWNQLNTDPGRYVIALFRKIVCSILLLSGISALGQSKVPTNLTEAKVEMAKLYGQLRSLDHEFDDRVETEVRRQAGSMVKDEFETTKQYQIRLTRAAAIRNQLQRQYAFELARKRGEIQSKIRILLDAEFEGPATAELLPYDADSGFFRARANDKDGITHEEILTVPQSDSRQVKQNFDSASITGLYGVSWHGTEAQEYYFGFRVRAGNITYTTLPQSPAAFGPGISRYYAVYREPAVLYLRKTIDKYLKNPASVSKLEQEHLDSIDPTYLRSKFVVVDYSPFLAGGKSIKIMFIDRPDAMFTVWVYRILEIRSFEKDENDDRQMRILRTMYRNFLQGTTHSL